MINVLGLDHLVLRVRDLDRSLGFYRDLLGMPILFLDEYRAGTRPFVSARIGGALIDLVPDPTYDATAASSHGGLLHFCVEVDNSLLQLLPWLHGRGVEVIEEQPVPRMGANGIAPAIYLRDPDGYVVELKEKVV